MDMSKIENSYVYNKYSSHNYVDDELISHNWLNSYVNITVGIPIGEDVVKQMVGLPP
jgi:hypothetical protein